MTRRFWAAEQLRERELIISVLAEASGPVDAVSLRYGLDMLGSPVDADHFRNHLAYLAERGYIRIDQRRMGSLRVALVEITAAGRDLHSGLASDAGVGGDGADVMLPSERG
jgi:repressor of nif and glnA expression